MAEMAEDPLPTASPRRTRARPEAAPPEPTAGSLLARIAAPISRAREMRRVAEIFLQEVALTLPVTGWVAVLDAATEEATWASETDGPLPLRLARVPGSLLGNALHHVQPSVVHQLATLPEVPERPYLLRSGGAWAFLPVSVAGRPVACLILRASAPETLAPDALGDVREALPVLGLGLKAEQLQMKTDRAERGGHGAASEISSLYEVSRSLGWVLTGEDLFRLLAEALEKSLPHDLLALTVSLPGERACWVRAHGSATDTLIGAFHAEVIRELEESSGDSASDLSLRVERAATPAGEAMFERRGATLHAPLRVKQRVAGVLSLGARAAAPAWGASGRRLLQAIASQASLTLDRLRSAQEAEQTRLGSMLESMADGVLLLDRDLRILMTNPAARGHLERIGCGQPHTLLQRLGEVDLAPLIAAFQHPEAGSRTFEINPARGVVFSVTCSPVRGAGDDVEGMVVVLSDDSEARLMQAQIAQSEKLSALGKLTSGVAHELNNPLGTILGSAELLTMAPVDGAAAHKVDAIRREAQRCRKVVEALLHFVNQTPPEKKPLDVNAAIDTVLTLLEGALRTDGLQVILERDPDLPPVVGDTHLLQQVFYNIVNNARHAVAEAGRTRGRITIRTARRDDRVAIEVADSGPGIPEDCLTRIFDPFFSTKGVGKGTGLGLTLAYSTIRQHGGTLRAVSPPGEGATFVMELPAAPEGTIVAPPEPHPEIALAAAAHAARERGSAAVRILVVEDEIPLAEVVAEALATCGYQVDVAHDGASARRRIQECRYDLIITDMKMPDMSGRALHACVASQDPALARRVIFSTGDSANPETLAFFKSVGNPYLTKPFNLTQLLRAVEGALQAS